MTGLQVMSRDCFLPGTYLQLEKLQRLLQNQKQTIAQRLQWRLDAVLGNQYETKPQQ
jgi:hypothetical protein